MSKKKLGLYIHVPFCLKKCAYCSFYSLSNLSLIPSYVDCLCEHIEFQARAFNFSNVVVNSIYFGGGTPSLLSGLQLERILSLLFKKFNVAANAEICMECNPSSLSLQFLKELKALSFSRLSIGVQSAVNSQLKFLGRLHSFEQCRQIFDFAVLAGFRNLSADLIIGLPGQTLNDLIYSFEQFSLLPLTHISIYILKIERGTPLFSANLVNMPSDDELALFYERAVVFFKGKGFVHYEISNFAMPGFECVHNLKYWTLQPYLGFGPSAHSYFNGQRFFVKPSLKLFLAKFFNSQPDVFQVEPCLEWLMLRTRLSRPVFLNELVEQGFEIAHLEPKLQQLARANLIEKVGSSGFVLTARGFLVQNSVVLFLAEQE